MLHFIFPTLLLAAGMSGAIVIGYLPTTPLWYWAGPIGLLCIGLGLLLKKFSNWAIFLALPLACGLSYAVVNRYWPPPTPSETTTVVGHLIDRQRLPLQTVELQIPEAFRQGPFAEKRELDIPVGWKIALFAAGLKKIRMLAFNSAGVLFASQPQQGQVLALPDLNRDGIADRQVIFAAGLHRPHGLAFSGRDLLVAEGSRISRISDDDGDLKADRLEVVSEDVPNGGGHWTRSLLVGADGSIYLSAGSTCNACLEQDPRQAAILRFATGDRVAEIYASGLRNSVGLALHPLSGEIWASENGRDHLGDDLPPDEINLIEQGQDYGWPYCFGKQVADPDYGRPGQCQVTVPAAIELPAHSAPLGIIFARLPGLLPETEDYLLVASHGSWNRSAPRGYELYAVPFDDAGPAGQPVLLADGWLQGCRAWGRPVGLAVSGDGSIYLSDDQAGAIYRLLPGKGDQP